MIKVVGKSGNLANLLRCTSSIGATTILPIVPPVPEVEPEVYPVHQSKATAYTSAYNLPIKKMKVVSGFATNFSVRFSHTDVKVPDFNDCRREERKNPNAKSSVTAVTSKLSSSLVALAGSVATVYVGKGMVNTIVQTWSPGADVLALSKIEINKADIPEGKNITYKWRGKPVFVRHRTSEEIKKETEVDLSSLRDPEPDSARARDPEWLIVIGVCTHLGCVPIPYEGDWGGYFCPCHGSHYDTAGRIRKGPAPTNLEIPTYSFVGDKIIVG